MTMTHSSIHRSLALPFSLVAGLVVMSCSTDPTVGPMGGNTTSAQSTFSSVVSTFSSTALTSGVLTSDTASKQGTSDLETGSSLGGSTSTKTSGGGICIERSYNKTRASYDPEKKILFVESVAASDVNPIYPEFDWSCGTPSQPMYCCPIHPDFSVAITLNSEIRSDNFKVGENGVTATYRFLWDHPGRIGDTESCECVLHPTRKNVPVGSGTIEIRKLPSPEAKANTMDYAVRVDFPELGFVELARIGISTPIPDTNKLSPVGPSRGAQSF